MFNPVRMILMDAEKSCVIIPIRMLSNVKSRLSTVLRPELRRELNVRMLIDVVEATLKAEGVGNIVVVTPDSDVSKILRGYDVHVLQEKFEGGVNVAVQSAIDYCLENGVSKVLILPSDVPLICSEDLNVITRLGKESYSVVISPSARLDGTNALLLNPPEIIPLSYDQDSFHNYLDYAFKVGAKVKIYLSKRVMLDIDTPEDAVEFLSVGEACRYTYRFLHKHLTLKLTVRRAIRKF